MGYSILVEANLFLVNKLQPDLIIRAMLQVASILRSNLKLMLNQKNFYCHQHLDSKAVHIAVA